MRNAFVYRIAHDTSEARFTVLGVPDQSGIGAKIFQALAEAHIKLDMIIYNKVSCGSPSVSFLIAKKDIPLAKAAADKFLPEINAEGIKIEDDVARITVIGRGLHNPSGIVAELFAGFGDEKINIQMISTSETRVSCLVQAGEVDRAVKTLMKKFGIAGSAADRVNAPKEEIDFEIPFDAPFDYTLIHG